MSSIRRSSGPTGGLPSTTSWTARTTALSAASSAQLWNELPGGKIEFKAKQGWAGIGVLRTPQ